MRTVAIFVKGPGAGRESALRAFQTVGMKVTLIRDVTPDPAQRLPPAQAPPRLVQARSQSRERLTWHVTSVRSAGSAGVRT